MLNHPVPEAHLKSIGDITVSFALLESVIQSLIGSLIYENQRIGQRSNSDLHHTASGQVRRTSIAYNRATHSRNEV